jgi:hypothetical protein
MEGLIALSHERPTNLDKVFYPRTFLEVFADGAIRHVVDRKSVIWLISPFKFFAVAFDFSEFVTPFHIEWLNPRRIALRPIFRPFLFDLREVATDYDSVSVKTAHAYSKLAWFSTFSGMRKGT